MKHTRGPWHRGRANGEGYIFGPEGTRRDGFGLLSICHVYGTTDEDNCNARLISEAPAMLELIEAICNQEQDGLDRSQWIWERAKQIQKRIQEAEK